MKIHFKDGTMIEVLSEALADVRNSFMNPLAAGEWGFLRDNTGELCLIINLKEVQYFSK